MKEKYKPKLLIISIDELISHIKLSAASYPTCQSSYTDEHGCGAWADGDDGAGGGSWGHMCQAIGPLFGCNEHEEWYCSTIITPIAR